MLQLYLLLLLMATEKIMKPLNIDVFARNYILRVENVCSSSDNIICLQCLIRYPIFLNKNVSLIC